MRRCACGSRRCCGSSQRPSRSPSTRWSIPRRPRCRSNPIWPTIRRPMSDALLPYYDRELNALRSLAAEFAATHPKIAGRLRLAPESVDDPHVARLLEGVAFVAARVHHRLDDEFPELTDALLSVLYPHYLAPVPSAAIVQYRPEADLAQPVRAPAALALETEPVHGESCRFRTAWPVTLWPIEIDSVRLS